MVGAVSGAAADPKPGQPACPVTQIEFTVFEEEETGGDHEDLNTEMR
jgi:hypothetical protein